jgi:hypothetical protein
MSFSAYDSDGLRLLSGALSAALNVVHKSAGRTLTETETSDFSKRLTQKLMKVFDFGERAPVALERAALQEVFPSVGSDRRIVVKQSIAGEKKSIEEEGEERDDANRGKWIDMCDNAGIRFWLHYPAQ